MSRMRSLRRISTILVLLFGLGGIAAFAQFLSGVEGTVKDSTGALISGAKVTLTDTSIGVAKMAVTNQAGYFRIDSIAASSYLLKIGMAGFKTWAQNDLVLQVGETRTLAPVMEVGQVATEITVAAAEVALNLTSASTGSVIPYITLAETPLSGQNIYALAALTPGITGSAVTAGDNFTNEYAINVNAVGLRQEQNGYQIDGAQTNTPSRGGGTSISPNPEIVQSMEVRTNDFDASKGRNAGATVNVFTKSGTNSIHGTVDYYFTNNNLTAHKWFDGSAPLPTSKRNEYIAAIGGPVIKNKFFLFGSIEVLRSNVTSSGTSVVETQDFFNWAKANEPNTVAFKTLSMAPPLTYATASSPGMLTVAQVIAANPGNPLFAPPAGIPLNLDALGQISYTNTSPKNGYQWSVRGDYYLGSADRFYVDVMRTWYQSSGTNPRPNFSAPGTGTSDFVNVDWTHTISQRLLNDASINMIRPYGQNGSTPEFAIPNVTVNGLGAGFGGWGPGNFTQQTIAWRDVVTATVKTHTLKMGFDQFNVRENDAQGGAFDRASYTFNNILDFIQDDVTTENGTPVSLVTHQEAPYNRRYRELYTGAFFQDDWKIIPTLTVNAGIRFDQMQNFFSIYSPTLATFNLGSGSTMDARVAGGVVALAANPKVLDHNINGFGPRLGFSWDIFGKGKTALRGGIGMFTDQPPFLHMTDMTSGNLPNFYNPSLSASSNGGVVTKPQYLLCSPPAGFTISCPVLPTPNASTDPKTGALFLNGALSRTAGIGGFSPSYKMTQVFDWTLSVQQELMNNLTLELNYSASASHHLPIYNENVNRFAGDLLKNNSGPNPNPTPPTWTGLNPNFVQIKYATSDGNAFGNSGSAVLTRQTTRGFAFHVIYNFAKSLDTISNSSTLSSGSITQSNQDGPVIQNGNLKAQRGRSDFDIRHQFSADATYITNNHADSAIVRNLAGGWVLGATWIMQSGLPFWVTTNAPFHAVCGGNPQVGSAPGNAANPYFAAGECYDQPVAGSTTGAWRPGSIITGNSGGDFNADGENTGDGSSGAATPMIPAFGPHLSGLKKNDFHNGVFPGGAKAFPLPPLGQEGNLGRNTYDNQSYNNVNFTFGKDFSTPWFFGERLKLEAKAEVINLFNRANLYNMDANMADGNFGKEQSQLPARNLQFHLRASF